MATPPYSRILRVPMAQTFQGDVAFTLYGKSCPYRFEVTVNEKNKVVIWLEDRLSKKQWQTSELETKDFVANDNAIPKAKVVDYAERLAKCLESSDESAKYGKSLTTKGSERLLVLSLPLQWAMRDLSVEYKFVMYDVPLERIDLLGARMRDVEEKVETVSEVRVARVESESAALKDELTQRMDKVEAKVDCAPVFAQATTKVNYTASDTLVWTTQDDGAGGEVEFLKNGSVRFVTAGVYAVDIGIMHKGAFNSVVFELKKAETTLASCQGSSYNNYYSTTPLHYILKAEANDEIYVVYKATGYALAGSYMTIVKL